MQTGLTLCLGISFLSLALAQDLGPNQQARKRGQTPTQDPRQTLNRGRTGTQDSMPNKPQTFRGMLVDAGCKDRTMMNLERPADSAEPGPARTGNGNGSMERRPTTARNAPAAGSADRLSAERGDAMEHHTPDHLARQMDPSCAINQSTRAFGILLANGRLVNLDEGGNTRAFEAVQSTPKGQAMLNGKGPGMKPQATVTGILRGDTLHVGKLLLK